MNDLKEKRIHDLVRVFWDNPRITHFLIDSEGKGFELYVETSLERGSDTEWDYRGYFDSLEIPGNPTFSYEREGSLMKVTGIF